MSILNTASQSHHYTIHEKNTGAEKASTFLDHAIRPSLENNDCTKFHALLRKIDDGT